MNETMPVSAEEILEFWFAPEVKKRWFNATPEFDQLMLEQFLVTYQAAAAGELDHWVESPRSCLALLIVLDQFPLNMFRGTPQAFATETQAQRISKEAVVKGLDRGMSKEYKIFMYMPLMHSEDIRDQELSVSLFESAGLPDNLKWARHHRDIVKRFGRFPHRNAILGRESTMAEQAYLASKEAFSG
ncbi:MAG: DUF924 family protein [Pseudomonadota bacterium]